MNKKYLMIVNEALDCLPGDMAAYKIEGYKCQTDERWVADANS